MEQELSLREIQQGSFQVLKKIKEICEKENIQYFLIYGTLIGALRHKGFIPWDDDIDIAMPRKDYERFVNLYIEKPEMFAPFELLDYRTNKKYIYPIARLSDPSYRIDYDNAKEYGLGLFVDIYPLDGKNVNDKRHLKKVSHLNSMIYVAGQKKMKKARNFLRNIPKFIIYVYTRFRSLIKLLKKNDRICQKYSYEDSEQISAMTIESLITMEKKDFEKTVQLEFEGELFSCPSGYDHNLKSIYGDYMQLPPEEDRIGHHYYKVFKKVND